MKTANELFLHELSDILDAEHKILAGLSEQTNESSNTPLRSAFQSHQKQTEAQIERLEQCFDLMGEKAHETECSGIKGMLKEHEMMLAEDPAPDILDVFNVAAAIKVERYEISCYESLIRMAELMKQATIVRLLKQNSKEEEQTLKKMTAFAAKLKPENLDANEPTHGKAYAKDPDSSRKRPVQQSGRTGPQIVKQSGPRRNKAA